MVLGNNQKIGMCAHFGRIYQDEFEKQIRLMAEAGVRYVRSDWYITGIELVQGVYKFDVADTYIRTSYDTQVERASFYGIEHIALMSQFDFSTPAWATQPGYGTSGFNKLLTPDAYYDMCRATAERYKGIIKIYELGNEPNGATFWNNKSPSAANYTNWYLKVGYEAVKSVDPDAVVLSGGLSGGSWGGGDGVGLAYQYLQKMYAAGAKGYFDGYAVHPYTRPAAPSFQEVTSGLSVMQANGDGSLPIYVTEVGWYTGLSSGAVSEDVQAQYFKQTYDFAISGAFQYVPIVCWYDFKNDGRGQAQTSAWSVLSSENNYGIIHNEEYVYPLLRKPAFYECQKLAKTGSPLTPFLSKYNPGIYQFLDTFDRANGAIGSLESGQSWVGSNWTISSAVAKSAPSVGSEMISNGQFSTDTSFWTPINATIASVSGGNPGNCLLLTNTTNIAGYAYQEIPTVVGQWYKIDSNFKNGTNFAQVKGGISPGDSSLFTIGFSIASWNGAAAYFRATSTTTYISLSINSFSIGATVNYDNISVKPVTITEMMATIVSDFSDIDISVDYNKVQYADTGLIVNLDDASNPQNFVLATANGSSNKVLLIKCVNGVYSTIFTGNISYLARGKVRLTKKGNVYQIYYNNSVVGTPQTISDPEIVDNTIHGMWCPDSQSSLDDFALAEN